METAKGAQSYSLQKTAKRVALAAAVLLLINIVIAWLSICSIQRQNADTIRGSINYYMQMEESHVEAIQNFIRWTVINDPLMDELEGDSESEQDLADSISTLRSRVKEHQLATNAKYSYSLYLKDQKSYYNASEIKMDWHEYLMIRDYLIEVIESGQGTKNNFSWQVMQAEGETYLYFLIVYYNRCFAAYINISELAAPLAETVSGDKNALTIYSQSGELLYSSRPDFETGGHSSLFYSNYSFSGSEYHLPYDIRLYTNNFSNFGWFFLAQLFIALSSLGASLILLYLILRMYSKVILPIRRFTNALSKIDNGESLALLDGANIRELEETSLQFHNLIQEINRLKIDVYEKELEGKRLQIIILQNQIRPHFYLNCLTTIDSMAKLGNTEDICQMVSIMSRYLRYLFQVDKDQVRLEYELAHIQSFLDIQAMRYGDTFSYNCFVTPEAESALIPPLLLITFVGNILKHAVSTHGKLQIWLTAERRIVNNENTLCIDIVDSGQGFSQDVLDKLAHGEPLSTTTDFHIGITNSIQRLSLLYGSKYNIDFFNEAHGGAHVSISIPYNCQEGSR